MIDSNCGKTTFLIINNKYPIKFSTKDILYEKNCLHVVQTNYFPNELQYIFLITCRVLTSIQTRL